MSGTAIATPATPGTALAHAPAARGFIVLQTLQQAREFAEILCASDMVPKDYKGKEKVGNAIVAMQMGYELGLPPLQAIQNIAVINGRPSVWGDLIPAIVLSQPDCDDFHEDKPQGEDPEKWVARCTIKRRGFPQPFVYEYTWADAKRGKLAGKEGPWQTNPKRQMQMRARGFCARDAFPDRLKGLAVREIQEDYEPEAEKNVTPIREPQRVSEAPAAAAGDTADTAQASQPAVVEPAKPTTGNGGTPLTVTRGAKILSTGYVAATKDRKEFWELLADLGDGTKPATFLMANEGLYNEATSCAGTDHTFALHWKLVSRADRTTAKLLQQLDLEEGAE